MVRPPLETPVAAPTSGAEVRLALRQRTEIGLLDVRPEGPFADGRPLFGLVPARPPGGRGSRPAAAAILPFITPDDPAAAEAVILARSSAEAVTDPPVIA